MGDRNCHIDTDFAAQGHWVYAPVVVLAIEETRDTVLEMLEKHGRWVWPQAYCCALDPKWSEVVDCTQVWVSGPEPVVVLVPHGKSGALLR